MFKPPPSRQETWTWSFFSTRAVHWMFIIAKRRVFYSEALGWSTKGSDLERQEIQTRICWYSSVTIFPLHLTAASVAPLGKQKLLWEAFKLGLLLLAPKELPAIPFRMLAFHGLLMKPGGGGLSLQMSSLLLLYTLWYKGWTLEPHSLVKVSIIELHQSPIYLSMCNHF